MGSRFILLYMFLYSPHIYQPHLTLRRYHCAAATAGRCREKGEIIKRVTNLKNRRADSWSLWNIRATLVGALRDKITVSQKGDSPIYTHEGVEDDEDRRCWKNENETRGQKWQLTLYAAAHLLTGDPLVGNNSPACFRFISLLYSFFVLCVCWMSFLILFSFANDPCSCCSVCRRIHSLFIIGYR
jgi:hypothetical protein